MQVLAVVVVLVAALVVLVGVVGAELDRAERVRVEGVAVAEDVVDLGVVAGVEAVLLRDVGRIEVPVDLGREAEPFEGGGERDDPLGVVREAARDLARAVVGAERDAGEVALLLELRGGRGGFLRAWLRCVCSWLGGVCLVGGLWVDCVLS